MCASCGCGKANEDHGDPRHITLTNLEEAAQAADITVEEVAGNIGEAARTGGDEDVDQEAARAGTGARDTE